MDQSPYTPPKTIAPPPDQPPKRSWIRNLLTELMESAISSIVGTVLMIAWPVGLIYGWVCDSQLMFHSIYAVLILGPAIGSFILAFSLRLPSDPDSSFQLGNWIGTIGCCIIGSILIGLYATALVYKL